MHSIQAANPQTKTNTDFLQVEQTPDATLISEHLLQLPMEEGQVVIHIFHRVCSPTCVSLGACGVCMNPKVFLRPNKIGCRSELLHITHSDLLSDKGLTPKKEVTKFTLIFSGMPKSASSFDFIEPCERGWSLLDIQRNKTDVYVLKIHKSNMTLVI